ncbi:MAG: DUF4861 family protein [Prevotella sp.]|nr:DUF4861 family protein [Prevotella sp.]
MMRMTTTILRLSLVAASLVAVMPSAAAKKNKAKQKEPVLTTMQIINKVNDHYQQTVKPEVRSFWDDAAYHTGNMEAWRLTGRAQWLEYSDRWARHNTWQGATGTDRDRWRTTYRRYGEGRDHVLFADWQICFQTYLDLYEAVPAQHKIDRACEVIDFQTAQPQNDYWWWVDALYMGAPIFTRMYRLTGRTVYLDAMSRYYMHTDSLLWDAEAQLYYRDGKYVFPAHKTDSGQKDFWARGNGWALAALARILQDMPRDYRHRHFFEQRYRQLAEGVSQTQQKEGYWARSMADAQQVPGYETSGTAFFCYGLLWGINHQLLDASVYEPVAERAWQYLTTIALQPDGTVGYVQPIGERAVKGQTLTPGSMTNFGTGAFLLAACERLRYEDSKRPAGEGLTVTVHNDTDEQHQEVVEVDAQRVFAAIGISGGRQYRVVNALGHEVASQLTYDDKILIDASVRPHASATFRIVRGTPMAQMPAVAYGRKVPERMDDMAWENDRAIYRLYGPALQRSGERAYGNDMWLKNTPDLQMEYRFRLEQATYPRINYLRRNGRKAEGDSLLQSISFHVDHGRGHDCYKVGPSLGCGTPALMQGEGIVFPYCYKDYQLLDNGPLRFTVMLRYNTVLHQGDSLTECRLLTLDKGSNFNRQTVWYEGATRPLDVASGCVVHNEDTQSLVVGSDYVQYADPTDNPQGQNFQIYVGVLMPDGATETRLVENPGHADGIYGHALCIRRGLQPGERLTYYWGAAWSKYDCRTQQEWQLRIDQLRRSLRQPLRVEYP